MANKLISEMGLPTSIANIFAARNITTAKEALSLTEFELMELLDVGMARVTSAVAHISEIVSPPTQTALSLMEQRVQNEYMAGHLPTRLKGLDEALGGGIPFGVLTELVGPPGIGKTQFCLKLSLLASLPASYGGLDGRVIYIDAESKFSSKRYLLLVIQDDRNWIKEFPRNIPCGRNGKGGMPTVYPMAGRILVLRPTSLSEFTESLQHIKISLLQNHVKLLVIDSMAALVTGSVAEFSRIPIVVTNQVRSQSHDGTSQYSFQVESRGETVDDHTRFDSHLVAALGIHWAHAVTIRLVLEAKAGQRFLKVAKSPISPPLAFPFNITPSGISLLNDEGIEMKGPQISTIHYQGHEDIINFDSERLQ
ncbi:DNA repair protein RAD51-like 2 [Vitis vinifera]|uniref:DNA repair protein RAD51-like 2 n=1 Tax=Vitis vinifera TaxID=29760 RepID=A0A438FA26_VITVI|nr:DNA repair protein RAD51-like 2 [Vitis vinifera]